MTDRTTVSANSDRPRRLWHLPLLPLLWPLLCGSIVFAGYAAVTIGQGQKQLQQQLRQQRQQVLASLQDTTRNQCRQLRQLLALSGTDPRLQSNSAQQLTALLDELLVTQAPGVTALALVSTTDVLASVATEDLPVAPNWPNQPLPPDKADDSWIGINAAGQLLLHCAHRLDAERVLMIQSQLGPALAAVADARNATLLWLVPKTMLDQQLWQQYQTPELSAWQWQQLPTMALNAMQPISALNATLVERSHAEASAGADAPFWQLPAQAVLQLRLPGPAASLTTFFLIVELEPARAALAQLLMRQSIWAILTTTALTLLSQAIRQRRDNWWQQRQNQLQKTLLAQRQINEDLQSSQGRLQEEIKAHQRTEQAYENELQQLQSIRAAALNVMEDLEAATNRAQHAELQAKHKFKELETFSHAMISREQQILCLKEQINALLTAQGQAPCYASVIVEAHDLARDDRRAQASACEVPPC